MTTPIWLPEIDAWRSRLGELGTHPDVIWPNAIALANHRLDFLRTAALDGVVRQALDGTVPKAAVTPPVRLAVLAAATMAHLLPAIRVAGLRRGIHITTYEADYGQYWQELSDPTSGLHAFRPNFVLLALDGHHLAAGLDSGSARADTLSEVEDRIRNCWQLAREAFRCPVIHQTPLAVHPPLMGSNEHRLADSRRGFITTLNHRLRDLADEEGVTLLAIDDRAATDGLRAWHDPGLWHRAKQEVSPAAAPMYGELLGRLIAAQRGLSYKCLVLDLDNTLWGGVVGDDGLAGLVLGQGSALGEAFSAFQSYARDLSRRGIILAVCSKNDEANALEPFAAHPEMVLKRDDIACFVANWSDKPANLRAIAAQLNIGINSLVFADDNPFERDLVRRELPMVAVPELGDDPTLYPQILADAGYFEALAITEDDRARNAQYLGNQRREAQKSTATDLPSYLRSLEMELTWRRFDAVGLARTVQLINKTNQFNLTTRRYAEEDVRAVMADRRAFGLQLRLTDRFGDNGIISIIIGRLADDADLAIDTWLMSCRVLGRQVEQTTLNLIAEQARLLGAERLLGRYVPTAKNGMVKEHYARLGFEPAGHGPEGATSHVLDLGRFSAPDTFIRVRAE